MIRNRAGQTVTAEVLSTSGAAFSGTVTVYVTLDNGTQTLGTVASGVATLKGNGLYAYAPSQGETDAANVSFTFVGSGAIPAMTQYPTVPVADE